MITRIFALIFATCLLIGHAAAQDAELPAAKFMKQKSKSFGTIVAMMRDKAPYDAAKADQAIAELIKQNSEFATAFPVSSKGKVSPGSRFKVLPKVWDDPKGFAAEIKKLDVALAGYASKPKTLDGLKSAGQAVGAVCTSCHQEFRERLK